MQYVKNAMVILFIEIEYYAVYYLRPIRGQNLVCVLVVQIAQQRNA